MRRPSIAERELAAAQRRAEKAWSDLEKRRACKLGYGNREAAGANASSHANPIRGRSLITFSKAIVGRSLHRQSALIHVPATRSAIQNKEITICHLKKARAATLEDDPR
jgi:hypothetical protein